MLRTITRPNYLLARNDIPTIIHKRCFAQTDPKKQPEQQVPPSFKDKLNQATSKINSSYELIKNRLPTAHNLVNTQLSKIPGTRLIGGGAVAGFIIAKVPFVTPIAVIGVLGYIFLRFIKK
jgi:hypothetical protein